jgi:Flp pilus assembly protein TadD
MITLRLKPLLLASLALSLSACAPKPQPPAQPAQGHAGPSAPDPIPEGAATTPRLQEAVEAAADLFNRGENDLACEQVRRAEGVKGSNSSADAALTQQLNDYRQACEPTP